MLEIFGNSADAVFNTFHRQYPTATIKSTEYTSHGKHWTMRYAGQPLFCDVIENRNMSTRNRLRKKLLNRFLDKHPNALIILP